MTLVNIELMLIQDELEAIDKSLAQLKYSTSYIRGLEAYKRYLLAERAEIFDRPNADIGIEIRTDNPNQ